MTKRYASRMPEEKPDGRVALTAGLLLDTQKGLYAAPGSYRVKCLI